MKKFSLVLALCAATLFTTAQTYHEDDKEGLRIFLRQASAEAGKINALQLGLTISDTINWETDETWVTKIFELNWDTITPKRLIGIGNSGEQMFSGWYCKNLAGTLSATKWTKLKTLSCSDNKITDLDLSTNTELKYLYSNLNLLTNLDLSANIELEVLVCSRNQLTTLDLSTNIALRGLSCLYNQLTALDLSTNLALSELACQYNQLTSLKLKNNGLSGIMECFNNRLQLSYLYNVYKNSFIAVLGTQRLLPKEVAVNSMVDFYAQRQFEGVSTVFTVEKDSVLAIKNTDYTISNGRITFKSFGHYTVTMTNAAIV